MHSSRVIGTVAIIDQKVIDLSSLFLSFFIQGWDGCWDYYPQPLSQTFQSCYDSAMGAPPDKLKAFQEPLVWGFDAFALLPSHNIENMVNLFYRCRLLQRNEPWLVPIIENLNYKKILDFFRKHAGVSFVYFSLEEAYKLGEVYMIDPVHGIEEPARKYIHQTLIPAVISSHYGQYAYTRIAILKLADMGEHHTEFRSIRATAVFFRMLRTLDIHLLDESIDEAEKIYLINSAEYLLVSWGANHVININYWLMDTPAVAAKYITVLVHPGYHDEAVACGFNTSKNYVINPGDAKCLSPKHVNLVFNVSDADNLSREDLKLP
jgi:hypothetical protein